MMEAAETTAETLANGEEPHAEATLLGLDAEGWVYTGVAIFIVLAVVLGKVPARIASALDGHIAGVRKQLDEAAALRAEAEVLLADAKARQAAAVADAAAIRARAETEAADLVAASQAAASDAITRRTAAAEARIAAAERAAAADLKAEVAAQVTRAAATIIAARSDSDLKTRLTEEAIAGLDRRLH
ncbi:F0F1 ATP synthase subunit B family protein [Sandarakinorhabdus sp.]|uniref:F0F1 ATP synthase subunit B family protein n=1 Tax=Sandarakinorhabdus sp. TaxID=1916663 RepID=UPI003F6ED456